MGGSRVGGSAVGFAVRGRMWRRRDAWRVVTLAWLERLVADEGEPFCSGKRIEGGSNRTKTSKYAGSRLKKQILVCLAMRVTDVNWFPAWSDLGAAKRDEGFGRPSSDVSAVGRRAMVDGGTGRLRVHA